MCSIFGFCGEGGDLAEIQTALGKTRSRGPDGTRIINTGNGWLGFNRLSIMGLTENGMQPFVYGNQTTIPAAAPDDGEGVSAAPDESELILVCNGEIYGFRGMKEDLLKKGYTFICKRTQYRI